MSIPSGIDVAHYVRLVDVSDPLLFTADRNADGFDVDGVKALNTGCKDEHDKCSEPPWPQDTRNTWWPRRGG